MPGEGFACVASTGVDAGVAAAVGRGVAASTGLDWEVGDGDAAAADGLGVSIAGDGMGVAAGLTVGASSD